MGTCTGMPSRTTPSWRWATRPSSPQVHPSRSLPTTASCACSTCPFPCILGTHAVSLQHSLRPLYLGHAVQSPFSTPCFLSLYALTHTHTHACTHPPTRTRARARARAPKTSTFTHIHTRSRTAATTATTTRRPCSPRVCLAHHASALLTTCLPCSPRFCLASGINETHRIDASLGLPPKRVLSQRVSDLGVQCTCIRFV